MNMIVMDIDLVHEKAGFLQRKITTVLTPVWTTDWLSAEGRRKLLNYGIAPPAAGGWRKVLFGKENIASPRCGSGDTERISEFGSTSCKALWRCTACQDPFDYFKCI